MRKEQALKIEEASEYDKNLKISRQRENEEYTYQQKIERKKTQDKAEAETALRDKQTQTTPSCNLLNSLEPSTC